MPAAITARSQLEQLVSRMQDDDMLTASDEASSAFSSLLSPSTASSTDGHCADAERNQASSRFNFGRPIADEKRSGSRPEVASMRRAWLSDPQHSTPAGARGPASATVSVSHSNNKRHLKGDAATGPRAAGEPAAAAPDAGRLLESEVDVRLQRLQTALATHAEPSQPVPLAAVGVMQGRLSAALAASQAELAASKGREESLAYRCTELSAEVEAAAKAAKEGGAVAAAESAALRQRLAAALADKEQLQRQLAARAATPSSPHPPHLVEDVAPVSAAGGAAAAAGGDTAQRQRAPAGVGVETLQAAWAARDAALQQLYAVQAELAALRVQHAEAQRQADALRTDAHARQAELGAQLSSKRFMLDRLQLQHNDTAEQLRAARSRCCMLSDKVELLQRSAYDAQAQLAGVRAEAAAAGRGTGSGAAGGGAGAAGEGMLSGSGVLGDASCGARGGGGGGSCAGVQRALKEQLVAALRLAPRLVKALERAERLSREKDAAVAEVKELRQQLHRGQAGEHSTNGQAGAAAMTHAARTRAEDAERLLRKYRAELDDRDAELRALRDEHSSLRNDMQRLLEERGRAKRALVTGK